MFIFIGYFENIDILYVTDSNLTLSFLSWWLYVKATLDVLFHQEKVCAMRRSLYFGVWKTRLLNKLDTCFWKRKQPSLPRMSMDSINFFCRGRWNRKLELSQKVMNNPCATWERGLLFDLDLEPTLVNYRHCASSHHS